MPDYKEYIYAVYKERSFSKAAQKLFVSQPWLSSAVKKVEQELGASIFDRSTTPISLTDAGAYYIERVEQIMAIEQEIQQYFKELRASQGTELHIGSSMFFCTYVLPTLLADFRAMYPQVSLIFSEGSRQELLNKLLDGKLDFILEVEQMNTDKLHSIHWATEELVLAVPAQFSINQTLKEYCYSFDEFLHRHDPSRRKPTVPLHVFRDESFILLNQENDIHNRALQICRNAGFSPNAALYMTQMMTAYYLVCEGQGVTFLRSTIPDYVSPTNSVVFYQLDDPLAIRNIYLSYSKKRTGAMSQNLIDFMKAATT